MWKYRNAAIFFMGMGFASKALVRPDYAAVCGCVLMFALHYIDRFFSAERLENKMKAKVEELETAMKDLKVDLGHLKMNAGITRSRQV